MREGRQYLRPQEIYRRSFKIIAKEFGEYRCEERELLLRTRIAHTTADVEFAKSFIFHPQAIKSGVRALQEERDIYTDVSMVSSGVRSRLPEGYTGRLSCMLYSEEAAQLALNCRMTKSAAAIRLARGTYDRGIVAIGNAPTALFELIDLIKEGLVRPALVIGVPVGFVGAAESKQELLALDIPYITNPDRRGGSTIAAALINGLITLSGAEDGLL